jgi:hypothetical protein
MEKIYLP